jgi:carboxypeptidase T
MGVIPMKKFAFLQQKRIITIGFCLAILLLVPFSSAVTTLPFNPASTEPYHYHTYQELTAELHSLQANHSDIMSLTSIGKTYEGRDLWMVKLSDNVNQEEGEPGVLFMGAHHGNEKPSYEVCLFFIHYMVEQYGNNSLSEIRDAINSTQIYVIPMVNPDGVEANTRKNCAPNHGPFGLSATITSYGVNLNRNYDDPWFLAYIFPASYSLPFILPDSSFNYRGPYPFSANETKAIKNFAENHTISISISYHSYGEFIIYPWMHTTKQTPDEPLFRSVGENISLINNYYLFVKNYHVIPRYGGTLGSSENWLYRARGILAYTIELCKERAPSDPQVMYELCVTQTTVHLYLCQRAQTIESEKTALHHS